jgi:hypothetical protein
MDSITPETFINAIFPPENLAEDEVVCLAHPAEYNGHPYFKQYAATPRMFRTMDRHPEGWLYCVSTVDKPPQFGKVKRKKENLHNAWVLVLDDIGTKSRLPPLIPNYILETSPGNTQWGYFLQPFPVIHQVNSDYYHACLMALADAGYHDPGAGSATRCVKLPGAIHSSGFVTRVLRWNPEQGHFDLPELMDAFGVHMPLPAAFDPEVHDQPLTWKEIALEDSTRSRLSFSDITDPVSKWIQDQGLYLGERTQQWLHMVCPWAEEHSKDNLGSSTSYSPLDYGYEGRQWKCMHGHCARRTTNDFLEWVAKQGGPDAHDLPVETRSVLLDFLKDM